MDAKIALLTIGTEITSGLEADTNSFYLSKELFNHGFVITKHVSVPDKLDDIAKEINELSGYFDVVITTGGIGPTADDLTREAVAKAFGLKLVLNEELYKQVLLRHEVVHAKKLAGFPEGAAVITPSEGLIGGFFLRQNNSMLISLPGVPAEIEVLLHDQVLPILEQHFKPKANTRRQLFKIANIPEVQVEKKLATIKGEYFYGLLPKLGEVHLYITVKDQSASEADRSLEAISVQIKEIFGKELVGVGDETLEETTVKELIGRNISLAAAESSTGGLLSSRLTSIADSSKIFQGSLITYSNKFKEKIGVDPKLIEKNGAVSQEVALALAQAARVYAGTDLAVAITGIAGPSGATKQKPVGLHFIAINGSESISEVKKYIFKGTRRQIQWQASQQALLLIREAILTTDSRLKTK